MPALLIYKEQEHGVVNLSICRSKLCCVACQSSCACAGSELHFCLEARPTLIACLQPYFVAQGLGHCQQQPAGRPPTSAPWDHTCLSHQASLPALDPAALAAVLQDTLAQPY